MAEKPHAAEVTSGATDPDARLPHDRDESSVEPRGEGRAGENRKPIGQAYRDVEAGLKDTEGYGSTSGTPSDVPSAAENER